MKHKDSKLRIPLCLSFPFDKLLNQAQMVYKRPHNIKTALAENNTHAGSCSDLLSLFKAFCVTPDAE